MQASPRGGTEKVFHALLIGVFTGEIGFGKPQPEPFFRSGLDPVFSLETRHMCSGSTDVTASQWFQFGWRVHSFAKFLKSH